MLRYLSRAVAVLRRVNLGVEIVLRHLAVILIAAMLATVVWTVIARLSGISAPWTEKVMLILLPTLAFLVAPIAYRRAANVSLDLFRDLLPPRLRRLHALLLHLVVLGMLLIALDLSLRKIGLKSDALTGVLDALFGLDLNAIRPFKARIRIPVLGLEWRYVFMVLPACLLLMVAVNLELLLRHVIGLFDPENRLVRPVRSFEDAAANLGE